MRHSPLSAYLDAQHIGRFWSSAEVSGTGLQAFLASYNGGRKWLSYEQHPSSPPCEEGVSNRTTGFGRSVNP